ncbi:MAG: GFA family protein [Pseudomonadota bacterium]
MKVHGACLCGDIKFTAEVDEQTARICHCTDCQINSASAFGTVVTLMPGTFKMQSGELSTYIKTADSGAKRALTFCGRCGTRIYSSPAQGEGITGLRIGCLEERNMLPPKLQYWCDSALDWAKGAHDLPSYPKAPSPVK